MSVPYVDRIDSIDVFRLVAFFFVVILHAGFFEEYGFYAGVIFRLFSRWAVPFFFMLTGFFIFHSVVDFPFQRHVAKLLRVFVVSSCIYFFVNILRHDDAFGGEYPVFAGTYLHLWFLNSMLVGLLLFWLLRSMCSLKTLLLLALFLYFSFFICDLFNAAGENKELFFFIRHLSGFSFIVFGYFTASLTVQKTISLWWFPGLACLIIGEPLIVYYFYDISPMQRQLPFFALLFSMVLLLCLAQRNIHFPSWIPAIGSRYTLCSYVVHPLFLAVFYKIFKPVLTYYTFPMVVFSFICSLLFSYLLDRFFNRVFMLLNGCSFSVLWSGAKSQ